MSGKTLTVPGSLNVRGRGLSPIQTNNSEMAPKSSQPNSTSSSSDDENDLFVGEEEFTVLGGVRQMNDILVKQIDTLRRKIRLDETNFQVSRVDLIESRQTETETKDEEIDNLRESVTGLDHKIIKLTRENNEKDRLIAQKSAEIDELKLLVKQTKENARKINRQVGRIKLQKEKLESDPIYKQQNEEIVKLNSEFQLLKERLATVEQELERAVKVIEQQNEKVLTYDTDRISMQEKFQADLEQAKRSMNHEVERMKEVMSQNCEEMKNIKSQNKDMLTDVSAIKEMIMASKSKARVEAPRTVTPAPSLPAAPLFQSKPLMKKPAPSQPAVKQQSSRQMKSSQIGNKRHEPVITSASEHFSGREDTPDISSRTERPGHNPVEVSGAAVYTNPSHHSSTPVLPPLYVSDLRFQPPSSSRGQLYGVGAKFKGHIPKK